MTTTHVMLNGKPITRAYHDEADHGWQYYSAEVTRTKDAMIVALHEIVELDPGLLKISDLRARDFWPTFSHNDRNA